MGKQNVLAVMVGNAVTEFGLFAGERMAASWQLSTPERLTVDEARLQLASGLARFAAPLPGCAGGNLEGDAFAGAAAAKGGAAAKLRAARQDGCSASEARHGAPAGATEIAATAGLFLGAGFGRILPEGAGAAQGLTAVLGSVVPGLTDVWRDALAAETGRRALVLGPRLKTGMAIACKNAGEVGADRVADAIAAKALVGAPAIVVHLEVATAITVVDEKGALAGGIIAPGFEASDVMLSQLAARLPQVEVAPPKRVVGKTTQEAIASGIFWGEVARLDGLVAMVRQEMAGNGEVGGLAHGALAKGTASRGYPMERKMAGDPDVASCAATTVSGSVEERGAAVFVTDQNAAVPVLITGEGAALLAPHLQCRPQMAPHLTLQGLALCAQKPI